MSTTATITNTIENIENALRETGQVEMGIILLSGLNK